MNDQPERPAGWYPHDTMADTVRYWDGASWTGQVAPARGTGAASVAAAPTGPESAATKPGPDPAAAKAVGIGCLSLIGLFVVFTIIAVLTGDGDDQDPDGDKYGAQNVCEQFVEKRLKAPATADFTDTASAHSGGGAWRVTGAVDSENSFGANVRSTYVCQVQHTGDGNWRLTSLDVQ